MSFRTSDRSPEVVQELFQEHPRALVVVEACANAGWVHDVAVACGLRVKVANTAGEAPLAEPSGTGRCQLAAGSVGVVA